MNTAQQKALDEKRKTSANEKGEIKTARIIANYGDPGLEQDHHFDILSRYVIVMIESCMRMVTKNKWFNMIAVVQRPEHLWVKAEGLSISTSSQRRSDSIGNISIGPANNFSTRGIPTINTPYFLGEKISIKKKDSPWKQDSKPTFFQSIHTDLSDSNGSYGSYHSTGVTFPYIDSDAKVNAVKQKTITPQNSPSNGIYKFRLNKYQYEVFMLQLIQMGELSISTTDLQNLFLGNSSFNNVYAANGGYLYKTQETVDIAACQYEDINVGGKMRSSSSECIPLVVTTPHSFPTPKSRAAGFIQFNPTYSPIGQ